MSEHKFTNFEYKKRERDKQSGKIRRDTYIDVDEIWWDTYIDVDGRKAYVEMVSIVDHDEAPTLHDEMLKTAMRVIEVHLLQDCPIPAEHVYWVDEHEYQCSCGGEFQWINLIEKCDGCGATR